MSHLLSVPVVQRGAQFPQPQHGESASLADATSPFPSAATSLLPRVVATKPLSDVAGSVILPTNLAPNLLPLEEAMFARLASSKALADGRARGIKLRSRLRLHRFRLRRTASTGPVLSRGDPSRESGRISGPHLRMMRAWYVVGKA